MDMPALGSSAESMEASDYRVADLPYHSTKAHKIDILQYGGVGTNRITANGKRYVQDAQILFKFPVHLPPKEAITKLYSAVVELSVTKLSDDGYPDTEWICFIDQKICSGRVYEPRETTWQANINWPFWSNLKGDMGDAFVTQLHADQVGRFQGKTLWEADHFSLKIEDLIKNSSYEDVLSFIYDGAAANVPVERDIRVVVADDTRVEKARLVLEYQEDTCKAFDVTPKKPAKKKPNPAAQN